MNIKVQGGQVLSGEIFPSGSKNSAVHVLPCTLLIKGLVTLNNVPDISDVDRLVRIMMKLGSVIDWDRKGNKMVIDNRTVSFDKLTKDDLGNMRGTSLLWGALLSRFGKVDTEDFPGGCTLGFRSLEPIYKVFKDFGVEIDENKTGIKMHISRKRESVIWLTEMSPTATTNLLMLAVGSSGKTRLVGAASEPQCQDVCNFLIKAGAKISGVGSSVLDVEGAELASRVEYTLLPDHYEITTFLALGAVTGGEIKVHNAIPEHLKMIVNEFKKFNIAVEFKSDTALVRAGQDIKIVGNLVEKTNVIRPQPWPALPVDLLPIFVPLALAAPSGYVLFHNWMYEAGLFWTSELIKMGAEIIMADPHRIIVMGGRKLRGAVIEAPYIIRAVVSYVMAAMIAEGETTILNADALYRGHPKFSENLSRLGAVIKLVE
jgi:UDP-N-acetylglucosamine 1-carboxyvinyltransferase